MIVKTYEELFKDKDGNPKKLTVRDLIAGFEEDTETDAVRAFGGKLNIRPPYQRGFVYGPERKQLVIKTILNGYPLNVMYWVKTKDGHYELLDGQQRTMSICKYADHKFSIMMEKENEIQAVNFDRLSTKEQEAFLDYPLTVYICDSDDDDEKMAWFKIINLGGVELTPQELRNAIFNSKWVINAKYYFASKNCQGYKYKPQGAKQSFGAYVDVVDTESDNDKSESSKAISRQKLLEIALSWATDKYNRDNNLSGDDAINIDRYMQMHNEDDDADELWRYYQDVMKWVMKTFPTYRSKYMKSVQWGILYNKYHKTTPVDADERVNNIIKQGEVTINGKIYEAVLSGDTKILVPRKFEDDDKEWAYEQQEHKCLCCGKEFPLDKMQGDHVIPWSKGGTTTRDNLQVLCDKCNLRKKAYDADFRPWDNKTYNTDAWKKQDNKD